MRLIVISPPKSLSDEPHLVARMLEHYPVTLHLRKPDQGAEDIADYLSRIPEALQSRIMVHGHDDLIGRFNLKGIHFTENVRIERLQSIRRLRQERPDACISSAFHRIGDIPEHDGLFDYIFLSPIFDSISKVGYRAAFEPGALKQCLSRTAHIVIALGGIDAQRLIDVASLGFKGAAVLGAVWQAPDPVEAVRRLWAVCSMLVEP
jgi:thiamine-phosphate pyrophosphorylase